MSQSITPSTKAPAFFCAWGREFQVHLPPSCCIRTNRLPASLIPAFYILFSLSIFPKCVNLTVFYHISHFWPLYLEGLAGVLARIVIMQGWASLHPMHVYDRPDGRSTTVTPWPSTSRSFSRSDDYLIRGTDYVHLTWVCWGILRHLWPGHDYGDGYYLSSSSSLEISNFIICRVFNRGYYYPHHIYGY